MAIKVTIEEYTPNLNEEDIKLLIDFNYSSFNNLIEGLFIAPSHLSVGIQFADIVAGAIFRKYEKNDTQFYDKIRGSIRNKNGKVEGFGIVSIPSTK